MTFHKKKITVTEYISWNIPGHLEIVGIREAYEFFNISSNFEASKIIPEKNIMQFLNNHPQYFIYKFSCYLKDNIIVNTYILEEKSTSINCNRVLS
jgi:hypothetical protein